MIDLREKTLPDYIEYDGERFNVETDFRTWIQFDHNLQHYGVIDSCVLKGRKPPVEAKDELLRFYLSPNITPKDSNHGERAVDMVWDGDYIVASFMQAYGIDLTTIDYMHWHVFKALLYGLPEDTVMGRIMGYRTYQKSHKKYEESMQDAKRRYTLPTMEELNERENLLKWAEEAGL